MKPPCRGCTERTAAPRCHMTCEKYLAYRAQLEAHYAERAEHVIIRSIRETAIFRQLKPRVDRQKRGRKP